MKLLHPDKRSACGEIEAGGRESCDEAVRLVQQAWVDAKRDEPCHWPLPRSDAPNPDEWPLPRTESPEPEVEAQLIREKPPVAVSGDTPTAAQHVESQVPVSGSLDASILYAMA